jgi:hypothetical protein
MIFGHARFIAGLRSIAGSRDYMKTAPDSPSPVSRSVNSNAALASANPEF